MPFPTDASIHRISLFLQNIFPARTPPYKKPMEISWDIPMGRLDIVKDFPSFRKA